MGLVSDGFEFQNDTVFQICLQNSFVLTPTMTEECLAAVCFDERPSLELVKIQAIQEPMISVRPTPKNGCIPARWRRRVLGSSGFEWWQWRQVFQIWLPRRCHESCLLETATVENIRIPTNIHLKTNSSPARP